MSRAMQTVPFVQSIFHPSDFSKVREVAFAHTLAIALIRKTELVILHAGRGHSDDWAQFAPVSKSGDLGMRVRKGGEQTSTMVIFSKKPGPPVEADRAEVRKILSLDPKAEEFNVVYGSVASNDKEIAMLT